eukprot:gene38648-50758_t
MNRLKPSPQSLKSIYRYSSTNLKHVVNSHSEFDPLEEIIVGKIEGATVPEWHVSGKAVIPERNWDFFKSQGGKSFPKDLMEKAAVELDGLARILE